MSQLVTQVAGWTASNLANTGERRSAISLALVEGQQKQKTEDERTV